MRPERARLRRVKRNPVSPRQAPAPSWAREKGWGTIHALFDRPDTDFSSRQNGHIADPDSGNIGGKRRQQRRHPPLPRHLGEPARPGAIPRWDTARAAGKAQPAWLFTRAEGIMTDIGRMAHVVPARTQLPVSAYFDEALFAREQELIFKQSRSTSATRSWCPKWGLAYPGPGKRRACAGSQPARRRSHLKCLPPPSGADAWRRNRQRGRQLQHARQPEGHRGNIVCPCTAGPTTTRASCWARLSSTPRPA